MEKGNNDELYGDYEKHFVNISDPSLQLDLPVSVGGVG